MVPCKYTLITFIHCLMEPDLVERRKVDKDACKLMHSFFWHKTPARDVPLLSNLSQNLFFWSLCQFAFFITVIPFFFFNSRLQHYLLYWLAAIPFVVSFFFQAYLIAYTMPINLSQKILNLFSTQWSGMGNMIFTVSWNINLGPAV